MFVSMLINPEMHNINNKRVQKNIHKNYLNHPSAQLE